MWTSALWIFQTFPEYFKRIKFHDTQYNLYPSTSPLREIFSVLDLMKVDMANFAVSSIRPHLMQQSIEYERSKFQEFLEKQPSKK